MEHHLKMVADLERLKAKIDEYIVLTLGLHETGGSLLPGTALVTGAEVPAGEPGPAKDPPPPSEAGGRARRKPAADHPWNKRAKAETMAATGTGLRATIRECLADDFGEAWFSTEGMREAVKQRAPAATEQVMKSVVISLIDMTKSGELESSGAGTDRKYRAKGGAQ